MRCLIRDCREGNCAACRNQRCAQCRKDTRFIHAHEKDGKTFCGPSDASDCAWLYFQRKEAA
jgi:hypothetical protein